MSTLQFIFNLAVSVILINFINSEIITVPFLQEECPSEDRAIIFEDPVWEQDDEGQTVYTTKMGFSKTVDQPITMAAKVEVKRRGKWRFFLHQNFYNICTNLFEPDKPYTFLIKHLPEDHLHCPFTPRGLYQLDHVPYEGDVGKFLKLTADDVGSYRLEIKISGNVDGNIKNVWCTYIFFDVIDGDDEI